MRDTYYSYRYCVALNCRDRTEAVVAITLLCFHKIRFVFITTGGGSPTRTLVESPLMCVRIIIPHFTSFLSNNNTTSCTLLRVFLSNKQHLLHTYLDKGNCRPDTDVRFFVFVAGMRTHGRGGRVGNVYNINNFHALVFGSLCRLSSLPWYDRAQMRRRLW